MESYGERQVCGTLEGIREDHKQRYLWAINQLDKPAMALDAGCGVGYGSRLLSEKAQRVLALDISAESIEYANRYWKTDNIDFAVADLHFLRFDNPRPRFDAVVCFECIEHMAIPELFLIRLRPYLAPDARIFLSVPHETVQPFFLHRNPYHFMHYTQADFKALLDRTGYALCELCSQDDSEVTPGINGRFLVACCRCDARDPALSVAELDADLPRRLQVHFSRMGNELAQALSVKNERDRLKERMTEREEQLRERSTRLAEVDRERLIAQSKLAGAESLRGEVNRCRQEIDGLKKQQQDMARLVQRCEAQLRDYDKKFRDYDKKFRDIWQHPAIRRLARFNAIGLKCLSVFGFKIPRIPFKKEKPAPARASANLAQPAPSKALPNLKGKLPAPHENHTAKNDVYVRAFCAASNVYGAATRPTSGKRIVIDASRVFDEHLTGVGHYCDQLIRALLRRAPHEIALYSGRPLPAWILEYKGYPQFFHCPPQCVVNDLNKADKAPDMAEIAGPADLFLDISAMYAPIVRANKRLGCVYDLAPVSCPETVPESLVQRCVQDAKFMAQSCNRIVAISEFTKKDYIKHTACPEDRIAVVPVGLDDLFRKEISQADRARVRARFALEEPFLLCVGTLQPRKNLIRLLQAYGQLKKETPSIPKLLLTGSDKWADLPEFQQQLEHLHQQHCVQWLGYVDRQDMPALYAMSELFVYPSYFEGYGMPVAEAMASGAAVICANGTSLPEVAGDAAQFCDPFSVESIAETIKKVWSDANLNETLRQRALKQAESFPAWDDVADQYIEIMDALLK